MYAPPFMVRLLSSFWRASQRVAVTLLPRLGTEIFPTVDTGQFQIRMRAPTGTRIERTEALELRALDVINRVVGADNVLISTAFIGVQPASYPINTIYLFTSGPQEAVMKIALSSVSPVRTRTA